MTEMRPPDLRYVIPGWSENRWSDLLACLIQTDPVPLATLGGVELDDVHREVPTPAATGKSRDRLDLLLTLGGKQVAAIEVKVLSDLGLDQLDRYQQAFPDVSSRWVLHLESLPVSLEATPAWQSLTWEAVLTEYSASDHPWVAATAAAWLGQLDVLVPRVTADTVWNDVPDDAAGFELALRARVAWLASRMGAWCQLSQDLLQSSGGGAWVAAMRSGPVGRGHQVLAELQEGLPAQAWRFDADRTYRDRLHGPTILVGLAQAGVDTSADFDWPLLRTLFLGRVVDRDGEILDGRRWQTTSASPRDATDRANWQAMVASGAPPWLGKGYGMATARSHHVCAFGAKLRLSPKLTLGEVDAELQALQELVNDMAGSAASQPG